MVEVFKTNVNSMDKAKQVIDTLKNILPTAIINFDLEDVDKIIRIENYKIDVDMIERKFIEQNIKFELLK